MSAAERSLLVVDWDRFMFNPMLSARPLDGQDSLAWDWGTNESHFAVYGPLWMLRTRALLQVYGRDGLPGPEGWQGFWDRFRFAPRTRVFYADSNLWAGRLFPSSLGLAAEGQAWGRVSLWDAHHDCGYPHTTESLVKWQASGQVSCEDWMLMHYVAGSRLEVVYPSWREAVDHVEGEPVIAVDRRVDDGSNPDTVYDAVFVCRSGGWMPPWGDRDFMQFVAAGPARDPLLIGEHERWVEERPDVISPAEKLLTLPDWAGAFSPAGGAVEAPGRSGAGA